MPPGTDAHLPSRMWYTRSGRNSNYGWELNKALWAGEDKPAVEGGTVGKNIDKHFLLCSSDKL